MIFKNPLLIGLALFTLSSCSLTKDVQRIVDDSNAAIMSEQLEDGQKSAEQILAFIEKNPDLKGINQRLLVRLGAVYLDADKYASATAALDEAYAMAGVDQLSERDQMFVTLRGPLVWRHKLDDGVSAATEWPLTQQNIGSISEYRRRKPQLNDQLQAFLLREEITAARQTTRGFPGKQTTQTALRHRALVQETLKNYGSFWGEKTRQSDVRTQRLAADSSCVAVQESINLGDLKVGALNHYLLVPYSSSMYCEVERLLESYARTFNSYRFVDADDPGGAQDRDTLRQNLETPSWMTCKPEDAMGYTCSPTTGQAE